MPFNIHQITSWPVYTNHAHVQEYLYNLRSYVHVVQKNNVVHLNHGLQEKLIRILKIMVEVLSLIFGCLNCILLLLLLLPFFMGLIWLFWYSKIAINRLRSVRICLVFGFWAIRLLLKCCRISMRIRLLLDCLPLEALLSLF